MISTLRVPRGAGTSEPFAATRLGTLMSPLPGDPHEVEGVLNPAIIRGRDGALYLFARLVAAGNYSRIGLARVRFDGLGEPVGVDRLGIALEPREPYELNSWTGGGVEDPRVSYVAALDRFVMTYTAFSPLGPRVALAVSDDLFSWHRLGLVEFGPGAADLNELHNKDAVIFPSLLPNPEGVPSLVMIHRPMFPGGAAGEPWGGPSNDGPKPPRQQRASMWLSYCAEPTLRPGLRFDHHRRFVSPRASWERLKIGAGTPPIPTHLGWLLLYHGVRGDAEERRLRYSAGAIVLDSERPHQVLYRSPRPILLPGREERTGVVPNVVFPTGLDRRTDIGQPDRLDVYFGMADDRIGVARLQLPATLPAAGVEPAIQVDAA